MLLVVATWIIFGFVAGFLAKFLFARNSSTSLFFTIVLGIIGAVVGGFISSFLGFGTVTGFNIPSLLISVLGAILVLFVYGKVSK